jgi:hypothetical protein
MSLARRSSGLLQFTAALALALVLSGPSGTASAQTTTAIIACTLDTECLGFPGVVCRQARCVAAVVGGTGLFCVADSDCPGFPDEVCEVAETGSGACRVIASAAGTTTPSVTGTAAMQAAPIPGTEAMADQPGGAEPRRVSVAEEDTGCSVASHSAGRRSGAGSGAALMLLAVLGLLLARRPC